MNDFVHVPVMLDEVVAALRDVPAGVLVDATVGGGGHAEALLDAAAQLQLVGLDRDEDALAASARRLARFGERAVLRRSRFDQLAGVLDELGVARISGALFDLGVSSPQLDMAGRGFSFRHDGPLDMRMDRSQPTTAADVVNSAPVGELTRLLATYGDERFASRIAAAIVAARPLHSTAALAEVISAAIPAPARRRGGHPAKRSFQALRIAVNAELDVLAPALRSALGRCRVGGRVAVLAYHSGEDRIVKGIVREVQTGGCTCPPGLPCGCGAKPTFRVVRAAKLPSASEQGRNPRAASARLRVVECIAATPGEDDR